MFTEIMHETQISYGKRFRVKMRQFMDALWNDTFLLSSILIEGYRMDKFFVTKTAHKIKN